MTTLGRSTDPTEQQQPLKSTTSTAPMPSMISLSSFGGSIIPSIDLAANSKMMTSSLVTTVLSSARMSSATVSSSSSFYTNVDGCNTHHSEGLRMKQTDVRQSSYIMSSKISTTTTSLSSGNRGLAQPTPSSTIIADVKMSTNTTTTTELPSDFKLAVAGDGASSKHVITKGICFNPLRRKEVKF